MKVKGPEGFMIILNGRQFELYRHGEKLGGFTFDSREVAKLAVKITWMATRSALSHSEKKQQVMEFRRWMEMVRAPWLEEVNRRRAW